MTDQEANNERRGITQSEVHAAISAIAGDVFELFKASYPVDQNYYRLDTYILACAVQNAATHIDRAGRYHSNTGANKFKKAAYIGKSIATSRPVQVVGYPLNLTNHNHLNLARINSVFAVFAVEAMLGEHRLYDKLSRDIWYCFEFRQRMDEDSIAMLLEHALVDSPTAFGLTATPAPPAG
jgi:hypothetical protein